MLLALLDLFLTVLYARTSVRSSDEHSTQTDFLAGLYAPGVVCPCSGRATTPPKPWLSMQIYSALQERNTFG
jgi:hypothetical protein